MNFFKNRSILITGGTGSFGSKLLGYLLKLKSNKPKKVIVFSRDELKQFELMKVYPEKNYPAVRYFLGDIRDKQRLKMAFEDVVSASSDLCYFQLLLCRRTWFQNVEEKCEGVLSGASTKLKVLADRNNAFKISVRQEIVKKYFTANLFKECHLRLPPAPPLPNCSMLPDTSQV